ncbi:50S ribosomal protein L13 [Buchnera aphidicola]|uniref:50S ribosomal protein L13 n=1 Tax=Buchnera aphidicola TaxID=9 RepID=UPI003463BAD8
MKIISNDCNDIKKKWYYVDATDKILGRFASKIAYYLKGKHKTKYTPYLDFGDYIIVLNASKIIVTGNKKLKKFYYRHTGYVGGIKKISFQEMLLNFPERIISHAVKGMLPKGPLGRIIFSKLKVYAFNEHNHYAQKPKFLDI